MSGESLILDNRAKQVGAMLGYKPAPHDTFVDAVLPVEIPYSRDSDAMEFVNGLWQPVVKNMPRRYNDAWLNEPFATNVGLGSQLLDLVTYWTPNPSGTIIDQGISPLFAASTNVHSWLFTASSQRPFLYQNVTLVNASVYTFSFNCESITGSLTYNDCVVVFSSSTPISSVVIKNNGVVKSGTDIVTAGLIEYTFTCNYSGSHEFRFGIGVPDVRTGTLQASLPQIETGSVATSPIITGAAAVTRLADSPQNIATSYNLNDFSIIMKGISLADVTQTNTLFGDLSTTDSSVALLGDFVLFSASGAADTNCGAITISNNTPFNIGIVRSGASVKVFLNGDLISTTTATSGVFILNGFWAYNLSSLNLLKGLCKEVILYETALLTTEAIALTTI